MTIKGLTDRGAALPRIGILRKGAPKDASGRVGKDLNYFRLVTEYPEVAEKFTKSFGEQPTRVNVVFIFDEVEAVFEAWREHWVAGGLKHRCDGETMVLWQDDKGQYHHGQKPCPDAGKPEKERRCKSVGRLSAVIPDLERIATVTVLTTSKHDIMSLQESLEAAQFLQQGRLRGIPFVLTRREREVSTPTDDGKRARRKKSLLFIEPAHQYAKAALQAMDATPLLLPAGYGTTEDGDDEEDRLVNAITGEIIAPYEDTESPEPPGKPEPPATITAEEAQERAGLFSQIAADARYLMLDDAALHKDAKAKDGVSRYHDASTVYLRELAERLAGRRKEKEGQP